MDLLKQLAREAEQVEVVELKNESTTVEFEANKLKASKVEETHGIAARVVRHGQLGYAASSDLENIDKLTANVLESASYGERLDIAFPGQQSAEPVNTYDPVIAEMPIPRLVDMGAQVVDSLLQIEPEARINLSLNRGIQSISLRTKAGAQISFDRSPLSIELELSRVEQDDILIAFELIGTTIYDDDFLVPVLALLEKLKQTKTLTTIHSGRMPVLFSPSGSLALLLPVHEGLNGKNVLKGVSPMKDKIGDMIFDEKLTIIDDGTLDGRFGSATYDDEGIPHQRNVLIDEGVLKGFLYDLKTAAQSQVVSTGNGARSLFRPPDVSSTNFLIMPGKQLISDLIGSIDEGLLVDDLLGLGQGNILSGAFSNPLSLAFKIEKGEIVGRVKEVSIAGNVYEQLRDIAGISQEARWVYNNIYAPYILLPAMNVVSKN